MMRGQPVAYRQIIEISKQYKTCEWLIEKPYQGYLVSNTELKKGWYMASGEVRLDTARRDKQDLPVTVLKASQLLPCEDKDCKDLFEPARMVASMTSQPDWSHEAAMQLVKNVKEGNFE